MFIEENKEYLIPLIAFRVDKSCFESIYFNETFRALRKGKHTITLIFTHLTALMENIENDLKIQGAVDNLE